MMLMGTVILRQPEVKWNPKSQCCLGPQTPFPWGRGRPVGQYMEGTPIPQGLATKTCPLVAHHISWQPAYGHPLPSSRPRRSQMPTRGKAGLVNLLFLSTRILLRPMGCTKEWLRNKSVQERKHLLAKMSCGSHYSDEWAH